MKRGAAVSFFTEEQVATLDDRDIRTRAEFAKQYSRRLILIWKSEVCVAGFRQAQLLVSSELRMPVLPVSSVEECSRFIMAFDDQEHAGNRSIAALPTKIMPVMVFDAIKSLPGVGDKSARALLAEFRSLHVIVSASEDDLSRFVGAASAHKVREFCLKRLQQEPERPLEEMGDPEMGDPDPYMMDEWDADWD